MKRIPAMYGVFGLIAAALVFALVSPASAQSVDEKIRALRQELSRLEAEQIEMKKEAVAAAAALPTFSYRPGGGVVMMAADRSWAVNFRFRLDIHTYNHLDGNDRRGFTYGDLFQRRQWFWQNYCWDDCFYDVQFGLDLDTGDQVNMQYSGLYLHFENINPYYPTFFIVDQGGQSSTYVARSSTSSAQVEQSRDLMPDSNMDVLSHRAIGIGWINVPVGQGDAEFTVEYRPGAGISENDTDDSDHQQFFVRAGARPFRGSKNPWLEQLKFGATLHTGSVDDRTGHASRRLRLRTFDRVGQAVVWDANGIGSGLHNNLQYGIEWGYGPWLLRSANGISRWEGRNDGHRGVSGHFWTIVNELFLYSPRGLFSGSSRTPGSLQVGFLLGRSDAECGAGAACVAQGFSRNHLNARVLSAWYYIRPAFRIGAWWSWMESANTPTDVQEGVGCTNNASNPGKDCDWHSINLGVSLNF